MSRRFGGTQRVLGIARNAQRVAFDGRVGAGLHSVFFAAGIELEGTFGSSE
ncbi:MAG: hypothetical protein U0165_17230 [Polyangiaceae bacterium]